MSNVITRFGLTAVSLVVLATACGGNPPPGAGGVAPAADPATLAARQALANEARLDVGRISDRVIAVPPLSVRTSDTTLAPLGFGLADMLITDLSRSSRLTIVERSRMDALLREMQLVESGRVDTAHAPRVGRLLGARRLVVGTLVDRGNGEFGVETRLVNTVDASIGGAVSARASLASIFDAEKALAYRIFEELGITLTPAERALIEQRPTANITALLAYSRGVRDEAFGQYASAASNYRAALNADPSFGQARTRLESAQTTASPIASNTVLPEVKLPEPPREIGAGGGAGGGATGLATATINPSPVGTINTSGGSSSTTQQSGQQDRGAQAQKQPIYTTVVITVKQLP